jgi:hypothetical protein
MLHTYTGKNRCARAIVRPLAGRLCSEQDFTYSQVRLDLSKPVRSPALGGNALLRVFVRHRHATLGYIWFIDSIGTTTLTDISRYLVKWHKAC